MAFTGITPEELVGKGVTGLPDTPELSKAQMQNRFDNYSILLKDKILTHLSELAANTAAGNIGAVVPEGLPEATEENIQSVLEAIITLIGAVNIPTKVSDLTNDLNFIDNTVDNLVSYYLKSDVYTKDEISALLSAMATGRFEVVQTLPTENISTTTIYLVPKTISATNNVYDEYIYVNNAWEHIGDTTVDLSNYYTKTEVDTALAGKANTSAVPTKTSDLTNDSGFITNSDIPSIPSKTSDLTNDSGYITDIAAFTGATSQAAGTRGTVPAPTTGDVDKYLKGDGTWGTPSGGGGGGTSDYPDLTNKPSIEGVTLVGNKTASDLGLAKATDIPTVPTNVSSFTNDSGYITKAVSDLTNYTNNTDLATALGGKVNTSAVGAASGIAELDANGKVPSSQLPSYVDDVVEGYLNTVNGLFYEDSSYTTQITGETGKIYVSLDTDKTYRWSGTLFAEISASLALGETSATAYRGDRGKTAYDDSQTNKTNIGTMSNLTTTAQTSLVAAINELVTGLGNKANSSSLGTQATMTLSGTTLTITTL